MLKFIKNNKTALYGGLMATLFIGSGAFLLGNISGYEAKNLIEASVSGLNVLCNTIILAAATILALLLTLLGVSNKSKDTIKEEHYFHVLSIAKTDVIVLICAMVFFQFINIPVFESDKVKENLYEIIYWAILATSSIISGMMITVILMLYIAIRDLISIIGLGGKQSYDF